MKRHRIYFSSADLVRHADYNIDIQNTGLPDESYDMIICNHVLEHVDDLQKALKEVIRILRTGGSFICSFPIDTKVELLDEDPEVLTPVERIRRYGQYNHRRLFGVNAATVLVGAGFEVETIMGETFPENILPVIGPANYDINWLFHCVKVGKETK
ncbi:MAG: class I SAM-dependent methyltransferase [Parasporobacterium sp.]|nr:class I SAM-dependent methyltransferase [Parasporobacterium sp.]